MREGPRRRSRIVAALAAFGLVAGVSAAAGAVETAAAPSAAALDNGLAKTPPMGWNGFNYFQRSVTAAIAEGEADTLVSSGMKAAGYTTVNLDGGWDLLQRNAQGELQPDPAKFPDGIKPVADYVHSLGLKFGIYTAVGTTNCAGTSAGSYRHYQQDADTFASWGVDYVKADWCAVPQSDFPGMTPEQIAQQLYGQFSSALRATGRPMVYSMSTNTGNLQAWTWAAGVGNLWRTTGDLQDSWSSLKSTINQNAPLAQYARPDAWNDPDMLQVGNGGMTDTEFRTHFSLWAEMAAPLLAGTDLRQASAATMSILLNKDVIAVDQDPLGAQGRVVQTDGTHMVFAKPLANGDVAVALFNEGDVAAPMSVTASQAGLPKPQGGYTMKDLWSKQVTESAGTIAAQVPAHGTVMYRVSTGPGWDADPPATSVAPSVAPAYPGGPSVVAPASGTAVTTTFTNTGRVPAENVTVKLNTPAGWTVQPVTATATGSVPSGQAFTTSWQVTPPGGTSPGSYSLTAAAGYQWNDSQHLQSGSTTGSADVLVPSPPPTATAYVSDLPWTSASNGWGPPERDTSNGEQAAGDGHTITINSVTYAKGVGTNAPSEIDVYAGGHCSSFSSDVGVDDEVGSNGSVDFQVWADGTKVADSGVVRGTDSAVHLTAGLSGAAFLRMVVTNGGDGNSYDHGDWAGAQVTCH